VFQGVLFFCAPVSIAGHRKKNLLIPRTPILSAVEFQEAADQVTAALS
jgi:hypothetical protein